MTLYDDLGVTPDADAGAIKKAYRKLAQKHHPDRRPDGDREKFHQITVAYDVLCDDNRRKRYDETGDGSPEKTQEQKAEAMLRELFSRFITSEEISLDIVGDCRKHFEDQVRIQVKHKGDAEKALRKLGALRGRVKAKKKNVFLIVLDTKIQLVGEFITQAEDMLATFAVAITLLNDYEDTGPEEMFDGYTS